MAYQTPLTIAGVVADIEARKYLLPSIQREFVWSQKQIETLFDSLMRDYPINSFLFWEVPADKVQEFRFYEFLRNYHQRDHRHNPVANTAGSHGVTAILDGQQRLTSIYIGLLGSYASKLPYMRWNNPKAYPEKKLYLNLLKPSDDVDNIYDFQFLTKKDVEDAQIDDGFYWFPVGDILNIHKFPEVNNYLIKHKLNSLPNPDYATFANEALFTLFGVIHQNGTIVPYVEKTDDLDKVLNIFIRVNSGGTTLSYSDLLLSFATAQWDSLDAREEINGLVDELNKIGREFDISKDMVLKACLILCDIQNITFKVENFNRKNMLTIEAKWDEIKKAMRLTVELVASFGFNRDNVSSNNALIPIAYYLLQIGNPDNYVDSGKYTKDRQTIKRWFTTALLLHVFGSSPDGALSPMRDIIRREHENGFPLDSIVRQFRGTYRDHTFTEDSVTNLLNTRYNNGDALLILSLLYPWADLRNTFHVDHIHPKSKFTLRQYERMGLTQEQKEFYADHVNSLANLQLLDSVPNVEKSNMPFADWMDECYVDMEKRRIYMERHYIPDVDFHFDNFENFFAKREQLIFARLKEVLLYQKNTGNE